MLKNKSHKTPLLAFAVVAVLSAKAFLPDEKPDKMPVLLDKQEKSLKAFNKILTVLKSPRCINCHPSGDVPHQGNDQHLHLFGVVRGAENKGGVVQKCATCHHNENNLYSNVPGAPHWELAPKSMAWYGLTDVQIGEALVNKSKNGNRSTEDLVNHMSNDSLVLWAWKPGKGRILPPVPLDEFRKTLVEWMDNGAYIPTENTAKK